MNILGERIKKLRKQKKLTQTEVVGERLTKGMLSLIENGKAQPSMESLRFIANQLNVDVDYLIDDGTLTMLRNLYTTIEEDVERRKLIRDPEELQSLTIKIIEKIEPYLSEIQGTNYEQIRLREVYFLMNRTINKAKSLDEYWKFIDQYEEIHAYSRMLRCYFYLCQAAIEQRNYNETLAILKQGEKRIEPFELMMDPMVILDLYYNLTISYSAVDNTRMSDHYLQKALNMAKKKQIFYRMDRFYHLLFIQSIANEDINKCKEYIEKLMLLSEFADDPAISVRYLYSKLHYMNIVEKKYTQIVPEIDHYKTKLQDYLFLFKNPIFIGEEMYAEFKLQNYSKALQIGTALTIPDYLHHPIDLAKYYQFFAVRALASYYEKDEVAAKRDIIFAKNGVEDFPETIYKKFIYKAFNEIFI
ncbi:transcriptional regulator with XRE-family HTH domain [Solibacillus kalamii]|uniref:Transcriptional regulator n=1 Tax=Solibacillus kalamii TaxID=1748298 RepID=A0ABX3ZI61_9BACL|nr:helix-turn-helix transcriptional regulator [Solibacillus kalamii]MBM7663772.1 transcriptional regulator with XRE-family HTH domain [Solibacillus kalamii]OUZ39413.1 transcriptional regulator [Solibacillus kalamii]